MPMYAKQFMELGFGGSGRAASCAHSCNRCSARTRCRSPDNVRCPSCGHTWSSPDLPICSQCQSEICDCRGCWSPVGGHSAKCKSCYFEWYTEQHLQQPSFTITVHILEASHAMATPDDPATVFQLSCTNLAGEEILVRQGMENMDTSIGSIREELNAILGLDQVEKRLAPDGHFYSEPEFAEWCQRALHGTGRVPRALRALHGTGAGATSSAWDWAPVLQPRSCNLVLPNARVLDGTLDANTLSSLCTLENGEAPEPNSGSRAGSPHLVTVVRGLPAARASVFAVLRACFQVPWFSLFKGLGCQLLRGAMAAARRMLPWSPMFCFRTCSMSRHCTSHQSPCAKPQQATC